MSSNNSVKNLEKELKDITARIEKLELEKQEIENKLKNKNKKKNKEEKESKSTGKVKTIQEELTKVLQQRRKN